MTERKAEVIARRGNIILRKARDDDLSQVDVIAITCYTPIYNSYVSIVGEDIARSLRRNPDTDWTIEKINRIRRTHGEDSGGMWVLEDAGAVVGFVTFQLLPDQNRLWIEENGLRPERRGQGWATFMLRHLLDHARRRGIRFAAVEVDLDDAHIAARRAYQAVGFDRHHNVAIYHQDLASRDPGSTADAEDEQPPAQEPPSD